MFLSALVLVSIEGEHDGLKEGINFGERDEATEGGDVSRFGLEEEKEVGVLLQLAFIGVLSFCRVDFLEMSFDFALLLAGARAQWDE